MCVPPIPVQAIFIDRDAVREPLAIRIRERAGNVPVEIVDEKTASSLFDRMRISKGKQVLYVTRFRGEPVKPCPATAAPYLCCRYTVINTIQQCPMDCTYCILQTYLDSPVITLRADVDTVFGNIDRLLSSQPDRLIRFGTGELGDSLALDGLTGLSDGFMKFFSGKRNAVLEFKTKTDRIGRLLHLKPKNAVVSWSLNPQLVIGNEEFHTAALSERLDAARKCQEAGYPVGFHFDPVLFFQNWEREYDEVLRLVFEHVDASRIAWISLGTLRFPVPLKEIMQERFPKSRIAFAEMVRGPDGKMRYPRPRRIALYRRIHDFLKAKQQDLFIYFCMEHPSVWDAVTGSHPETNEELDFWFAQSLFKRFPELDISEPRRESYIPSGTTMDGRILRSREALKSGLTSTDGS